MARVTGSAKQRAVVADVHYASVPSATSANLHSSPLLAKSAVSVCHKDAHSILYQHCMECHFRENGYPSYYYKMQWAFLYGWRIDVNI
jgi:hypothetical protein